MTTRGCVPEHELYQAFHAEIPSTDAEPVIRHVLECPLCLETWNRFQQDAKLADSFQSTLRGDVAGADRLVSSSEVQELPENLEIPGFTIQPGYLEGGQARIYRGVYQASGEEVAIKLFYGTSINEGEAGRFAGEVKSLSRLRHPNVIPIRSDGEIHGHPYFVMPWIEGLPIDEYTQKNELDQHQTIRLLLAVAQALSHAHGRGVLHLDLKPSNVLIDQDGNPVVMDFGLAQYMDLESEILSAISVSGTPAYMAPEQLQYRDDVDARVDIFSFGLLMYETLTGAHARPERYTEDGETDMGIVFDEPLPIRKLRREISQELEAITHKAIDPNRARRYQTAEQVVEDLQRYLDGGIVQAMGNRHRYRLRKVMVRNAGLLLIISTTLVLSCFVLWTTWKLENDTREMAQLTNRVMLRNTGRSAFLNVASEWDRVANEYFRSGNKGRADICRSYADQLRAWVASDGETIRPDSPGPPFSYTVE